MSFFIHLFFNASWPRLKLKVKSSSWQWPIRPEFIPVSDAPLLPHGWDASPSQGHLQCKIHIFILNSTYVSGRDDET